MLWQVLLQPYRKCTTDTEVSSTLTVLMISDVQGTVRVEARERWHALQPGVPTTVEEEDHTGIQAGGD